MRDQLLVLGPWGVIVGAPVLALGSLWDGDTHWDAAIVVGVALFILAAVELLLARRFRLHEAQEWMQIESLQAAHKEQLDRAAMLVGSFDHVMGSMHERLRLVAERVELLDKRIDLYHPQTRPDAPGTATVEIYHPPDK